MADLPLTIDFSDADLPLRMEQAIRAAAEYQFQDAVQKLREEFLEEAQALVDAAITTAASACVAQVNRVADPRGFENKIEVRIGLNEQS